MSGTRQFLVNQVLTQVERAFERSPCNGRVDQAKVRRIEQLQAQKPSGPSPTASFGGTVKPAA